MSDKTMYDYLGGDDYVDCNCHSFDNDLVEHPDGTFQVICGCGVSGPVGTRKSAIHEWNLIAAATRSQFSAAQIISLWCIEKCREQGKDIGPFIENLYLSFECNAEERRELLASMGLAGEDPNA